MRDRLTALGWSQIDTVDDDLGRSAAGRHRPGGLRAHGGRGLSRQGWMYEALAKQHPKSRSRGRLGTPAEVVKRATGTSPASSAIANIRVRMLCRIRTVSDGCAAISRRNTARRWSASRAPRALKAVSKRVEQCATSSGLIAIAYSL
jgi:hypothetical protein